VAADRVAKVWMFDPALKKYKLLKNLKEHSGSIHGIVRIKDNLMLTYS